MDFQITPDTHPGRFTEEEAALFREGRCSWQTAYGLPWPEWCGKASEPGASFGHCPGHRAQYDTEMAERREAGLNP